MHHGHVIGFNMSLVSTSTLSANQVINYIWAWWNWGSVPWCASPLSAKMQLQFNTAQSEPAHITSPQFWLVTFRFFRFSSSACWQKTGKYIRLWILSNSSTEPDWMESDNHMIPQWESLITWYQPAWQRPVTWYQSPWSRSEMIPTLESDWPPRWSVIVSQPPW